MGKEELYKDFCWFPENMAIGPKLAAVEQKREKKKHKNSSYRGGGVD